MRRTARLLASAKPVRYLEADTPTGLTGLLTHPTPRPSLVYIYSSTLEKLKALPSSSLYRQSTEALTNHRLKIVKSTIPAGFEEWSVRSQKIVADHPEVFDPTHPEYTGSRHHTVAANGLSFVEEKIGRSQRREWDGEEDKGPVLEGSRTLRERAHQSELLQQRPSSDNKLFTWEPEPPLNADQISDIENQIGAGLIEEVIKVAEGELKLVDVMTQSKVWEELEEKPVEGQWTYFARDTATGTAQAPPQK